LKEKESANKDAKESKLLFNFLKEMKESMEYLEKTAKPILDTLISELANNRPRDAVK